jgi:hypothetical protein
MLERHGYQVTVTAPARMIAWTIVENEQSRDQISALLKRIDRNLGALFEPLGE